MSETIESQTLINFVTDLRHVLKLSFSSFILTIAIFSA